MPPHIKAALVHETARRSTSLNDVACGIVGGAPGQARVPVAGAASGSKRLAYAAAWRGSSGPSGPTAATWHCVQLA